MDAERQRLSGAIIRKLIAQGSKSEREAVILRTQDGGEYILRRRGGNAFSDAQLDKLVGSSIAADGLVAGQTYIMNNWNIEDEAKT